MMTKDRMIDLMYMYGADVAQKMEQIVSLELFGGLERADDIDDIEMTFYDAVTKNNKFTIKLVDENFSVIANHELLFQLDAHVTNILETVDAVIVLEEKGVKIDYNSVVAPIQAKTMKLVEDAIKFIREW